jgi:hypothetical protein
MAPMGGSVLCDFFATSVNKNEGSGVRGRDDDAQFLALLLLCSLVPLFSCAFVPLFLCSFVLLFSGSFVLYPERFFSGCDVGSVAG